MKLFSGEQIYAADKFTIEKQQITTDVLMERSAIQIFNWIHMRMQGAPVKIHLFCGIGNNGGDGIALARHLQEHGYNIAVYVVNYSKKRSKDFLLNLERLKARKIWPEFLDSDCVNPEIGRDDIIVDAIFGIGLNRAPDPWVVKLMQHLHSTEAFILSVDIPSGLYTNRLPEDENAVIKSNFVLSFQTPKLVFFLPETGKYIDQWEVLDIGLDPEYLMTTEVTAYIPECGYIALQTGLPEAMAVVNGTDVIEKMDFDIKPTVIGIGVGLGTHDKTVKAFSDFLEKNKTPLVIDADGLNILSKNKELLKKLPAQSILTPHPKELERLIGTWKDDFDKLKKTKAFSKKYNCIVVVKGAHSITVYGDRGYINSTGNPGMATAGSGDTLTGIITGLMAQGYEALKATIFGVYLHGKAGDLAVEQTGYQALTASDIIDGIGLAFIDLFKVPEPPQQVQEEQQQ